MRDTFNKAKKFIYRNARPLDLTRWKYHFENGSLEDVLKILASYQNDDGGFGHALEADSWNPHSSPIQTWVATEILREVNFTEPNHPLIIGILKYLESGQDFDGHVWQNTIPSNNDYPHAPWWSHKQEETNKRDYNPTANLASFIIKYADRTSNLYKLGCQIAKEAINDYINQVFFNDMHVILCYIRLM